MREKKEIYQREYIAIKHKIYKYIYHIGITKLLTDEQKNNYSTLRY